MKLVNVSFTKLCPCFTRIVYFFYIFKMNVELLDPVLASLEVQSPLLTSTPGWPACSCTRVQTHFSVVEPSWTMSGLWQLDIALMDLMALMFSLEPTMSGKFMRWVVCCVFQPANACLRTRSHGQKRSKTQQLCNNLKYCQYLTQHSQSSVC